jgi:hypothetical protein
MCNLDWHYYIKICHTNVNNLFEITILIHDIIKTFLQIFCGKFITSSDCGHSDYVFVNPEQ